MLGIDPDSDVTLYRINAHELKEFREQILILRESLLLECRYHNPNFAEILLKMHIFQEWLGMDRFVGTRAVAAPHTALDVAEIYAAWFNHSKAIVALLQLHLTSTLGPAQRDESLVISREYRVPHPASTCWSHGSFTKTYHSDFKRHPGEALAVHLATWQDVARQAWSCEVSTGGPAPQCVCVQSHYNYTRAFWLCTTCGTDTKWPHKDPPCVRGFETTSCTPCLLLSASRQAANT